MPASAARRPFAPRSVVERRGRVGGLGMGIGIRRGACCAWRAVVRVAPGYVLGVVGSGFVKRGGEADGEARNATRARGTAAAAAPLGTPLVLHVALEVMLAVGGEGTDESCEMGNGTAHVEGAGCGTEEGGRREGRARGDGDSGGVGDGKQQQSTHVGGGARYIGDAGGRGMRVVPFRRVCRSRWSWRVWRRGEGPRRVPALRVLLRVALRGAAAQYRVCAGSCGESGRETRRHDDGGTARAAHEGGGREELRGGDEEGRRRRCAGGAALTSWRREKAG
ncbi:hypothetical protein DFH08DRAFT_943332 [Mycena albidolilacea]|uniref:Uncharacterized protein n=1 Tax=Mycena albidolilacea TaxID=1033008 RepID=A0AAD6Z9K9_9AGAR|nr:hypothetical protein DFH08DRAFT_943332 [Mycena albidolilacea]